MQDACIKLAFVLMSTFYILTYCLHATRNKTKDNNSFRNVNCLHTYTHLPSTTRNIFIYSSYYASDDDILV